MHLFIILSTEYLVNIYWPGHFDPRSCSFLSPNLARLLRGVLEVIDQEQQPRHMVRHPRAPVFVSIFCSHRDAEPMRGLNMVKSEMVLDYDGNFLLN